MKKIHGRYEWQSVDTVIDRKVDGEIRRWHVYLNGKYQGTKHTVTTYTEDGIRSGTMTNTVRVPVPCNYDTHGNQS